MLILAIDFFSFSKYNLKWLEKVSVGSSIFVFIVKYSWKVSREEYNREIKLLLHLNPYQKIDL